MPGHNTSLRKEACKEHLLNKSALLVENNQNKYCARPSNVYELSMIH